MTNHKISDYSIGDLVLVKACNVSKKSEKKLAKFFSVYEGPYRIIDKSGTGTYTLINPNNNEVRGKFHISLMKPYYMRETT